MNRGLPILLFACGLFAQDHSGWRDYAGAADSAQYTSLTQIDKSNVGRLEIAWTFPTGDGRKYSFNPLMADGMLYVLAKSNSIVALDATSGKEMWNYTMTPPPATITTRGINYWKSKDGRESRLFFCADHRLRAIDAKTGKAIESFGQNGAVELKEGLDRDPKALALVQSMTPGRVFEDLIILGSATNQGYGSGPGDIRAFDVRTGKLVWVFHTVPRPGEYGYETWPKDAFPTWALGAPNAGVFVTLKDSRRICAVRPSWTTRFLCIDRSRSKDPGARRRFRPALP